MNIVQRAQMEKNFRHNAAFIKKLEKTKDTMTEDQLENLNMRKAQSVVWASQLKSGVAPPKTKGDMSAGSKAETGAKADATT